ncbi:MAG TPA: fluoride efflux transporter CrcB [Candidatus Acidoferrales bacterium]|nr:fluoride efflux transporter CrcB [Candidatus Acidoferrales bacterium]
MRIALLIVFGMAGTLARYGLQGLVQQRTGATFPYGTLVVNLVGCLLLGGIAQYGLTHLTIPPEWRIGITVGFFGAFTTFSTFGWETVRLLEDGEWMRATMYVLASVVGGLACIFFGMRIADRI